MIRLFGKEIRKIFHPKPGSDTPPRLNLGRMVDHPFVSEPKTISTVGRTNILHIISLKQNIMIPFFAILNPSVYSSVTSYHISIYNITYMYFMFQDRGKIFIVEVIMLWIHTLV